VGLLQVLGTLQADGKFVTWRVARDGEDSDPIASRLITGHTQLPSHFKRLANGTPFFHLLKQDIALATETDLVVAGAVKGFGVVNQVRFLDGGSAEVAVLGADGVHQLVVSALEALATHVADVFFGLAGGEVDGLVVLGLGFIDVFVTFVTLY
jgi:hypothetical protein